MFCVFGALMYQHLIMLKVVGYLGFCTSLLYVRFIYY